MYPEDIQEFTSVLMNHCHEDLRDEYVDTIAFLAKSLKDKTAGKIALDQLDLLRNNVELARSYDEDVSMVSDLYEDADDITSHTMTNLTTEAVDVATASAAMDVATEADDQPTASAEMDPATEAVDVPMASAEMNPATEAVDELMASAEMNPATEADDQPTASAEMDPATEAVDQPTASATMDPATEAVDVATASAVTDLATEAVDVAPASAAMDVATEADDQPTASAVTDLATMADDELMASATMDVATEADDQPTASAEMDPATEADDQPTASAEMDPATEAVDQPTASAEMDPAIEAVDQPTASAEMDPATEAVDQPTASAVTDLATEAVDVAPASAAMDVATEADDQPTASAVTDLATEAVDVAPASAEMNPATEAVDVPMASAVTDPATEAVDEPTMIEGVADPKDTAAPHSDGALETQAATGLDDTTMVETSSHAQNTVSIRAEGMATASTSLAVAADSRDENAAGTEDATTGVRRTPASSGTPTRAGHSAVARVPYVEIIVPNSRASAMVGERTDTSSSNAARIAPGVDVTPSSRPQTRMQTRSSGASTLLHSNDRTPSPSRESDSEGADSPAPYGDQSVPSKRKGNASTSQTPKKKGSKGGKTKYSTEVNTRLVEIFEFLETVRDVEEDRQKQDGSNKEPRLAKDIDLCLHVLNSSLRIKHDYSSSLEDDDEFFSYNAFDRIFSSNDDEWGTLRNVYYLILAGMYWAGMVRKYRYQNPEYILPVRIRFPGNLGSSIVDNMVARDRNGKQVRVHSALGSPQSFRAIQPRPGSATYTLPSLEEMTPSVANIAIRDGDSIIFEFSPTPSFSDTLRNDERNEILRWISERMDNTVKSKKRPWTLNNNSRLLAHVRAARTYVLVTCLCKFSSIDFLMFHVSKHSLGAGHLPVYNFAQKFYSIGQEINRYQVPSQNDTFDAQALATYADYIGRTNMFSLLLAKFPEVVTFIDNYLNYFGRNNASQRITDADN